MKTIKTLLLASLLLWSYMSFSQLKVIPSGFVGIGTNDPLSRLHVYGDGLIDSYAGTMSSAFTTRIHYQKTNAYKLWNEYFDRDVFFVNGEGWTWSARGAYVDADSTRMKSVSPIISPLLSVMQLNGLRFKYGDEQAGDHEGTYRYGLAAQEVENVVPDVVRMMGDSTLSLAYSDLVPLLIEAMKEQQEQIQNLQFALSEQEATIENIKRKRWFRRRLQ